MTLRPFLVRDPEAESTSCRTEEQYGSIRTSLQHAHGPVGESRDSRVTGFQSNARIRLQDRQKVRDMQIAVHFGAFIYPLLLFALKSRLSVLPRGI